MEQTIRTIEKSISPQRMLGVIAELSTFHRVQASQGYTAAARHCKALLEGYGIPAEITSYPADYGLKTMTQRLFQTWNCRAAWCKLAAPAEDAEMLADYSAQPIGVFQKSYPCDHRDTPLDIVLLDKGSDPTAYPGLDLAGKIIFVRDDFNAYLDWAVRKGGALGILSDHVVATEGVRTRQEQWQVRKYTTFWWMEDEPSRPFGFTLTPQQGEKLAALCTAMRAAHAANPASPACPTATCFVDAAFAPGSFENVTALLPGQTGEEIWLVAHLCHPRPSANDNLSGVAACIEAMKTLHDLVADGTLPPLKRGVRLLLMPEFLGTYAYIEQLGGTRHVKAALNLDMVGGKQALGYGPLTLSGVPDALPSFAGTLAERVFTTLNSDVPGFSPSYRLPRHNTAVCGFVAGSDNFILSDPTVGIPTPMLSQWPDKFYHTSGDDLSVISPELMGKSAALAASYAFLMANLTLAGARSIADALVAGLAAKLEALAAQAGPGEAPLALRHGLAAQCGALRSLEGFFAGAEKQQCTALCNQAEAAMTAMAEAMGRYLTGGDALGMEPACDDAPHITEENPVPVRLYRGPLNLPDDFADTPEKRAALARYKAGHRPRLADPVLAELLCQYYADGRRPLAEVAALAALACPGSNTEALEAYLRLLAALGMVRLENGGAGHAG